MQLCVSMLPIVGADSGNCDKPVCLRLDCETSEILPIKFEMIRRQQLLPRIVTRHSLRLTFFGAGVTNVIDCDTVNTDECFGRCEVS